VPPHGTAARQGLGILSGKESFRESADNTWTSADELLDVRAAAARRTTMAYQ
jgi:hypothetical protein